jgi:mono/diheme cytochrome c family protein
MARHGFVFCDDETCSRFTGSKRKHSDFRLKAGLQTFSEEETEMKRTVLKLTLLTAALLLLAPSAASTVEMAGPSSTAIDMYSSKCALCHAKNGAGLPVWRAKGQPDFTNADWQRSRTDAQLAEAIRNGKGKFMPSFKSKLSEPDITALVAVVRRFGKK